MWVIWVVLAIIVVLVIWTIAAYNRLIRQRNVVQESWRQVDVELSRRHDLIPNLVETVKGYAAHERGTFEAVTNARAAASSPNQSVAQQATTAVRVVNGKLSVRETERLVFTLLNPAKQNARRSAKRGHDADTARLETELAERLGARVNIAVGKKGAGKLVIGYSSLEQLDGIISRLR